MTTSLRERALRLLARCEQTRDGLARKLSRHGAPEEIAPLLDQLEAQGLLSDARYAQSFVASRAARYGALKLRQSLRARGVDDEVIDAHLPQDREAEFELARSLWARKFGAAPADAGEYARQARFLISRGFNSEIVRKILKDSEA